VALAAAAPAGPAAGTAAAGGTIWNESGAQGQAGAQQGGSAPAAAAPAAAAGAAPTSGGGSSEVASGGGDGSSAGSVPSQAEAQQGGAAPPAAPPAGAEAGAAAAAAPVPAAAGGQGGGAAAPAAPARGAARADALRSFAGQEVIVLSNYTQARLHAQRCLLRQACRTCAWSRPPLQHVCTQCSCTAKRLAGLQLRVARAQTWRARAARARGPQVSACLERISRVSRVSRVWGRRAGAAGALGLRRLPCLAAGQPVHGRAARGQRRAARRAECAAAARPARHTMSMSTVPLRAPLLELRACTRSEPSRAGPAALLQARWSAMPWFWRTQNAQPQCMTCIAGAQNASVACATKI